MCCHISYVLLHQIIHATCCIFYVDWRDSYIVFYNIYFIKQKISKWIWIGSNILHIVYIGVCNINSWLHLFRYLRKQYTGDINYSWNEIVFFLNVDCVYLWQNGKVCRKEDLRVCLVFGLYYLIIHLVQHLFKVPFFLFHFLLLFFLRCCCVKWIFEGFECNYRLGNLFRWITFERRVLCNINRLCTNEITKQI